MSTTTGPDLSGAKAAVERLMDDTCTIVRTVPTSEATVDVITLEASNPAPTTVYSGRCKVGEDLRPNVTIEGGKVVNVEPMLLAIPLPTDPANEPQVGDLVTIDSARRDPRLVNQQFRVASFITKTFAIQRKMRVEWRGAVGDRP